LLLENLVTSQTLAQTRFRIIFPWLSSAAGPRSLRAAATEKPASKPWPWTRLRRPPTLLLKRRAPARLFGRSTPSQPSSSPSIRSPSPVRPHQPNPHPRPFPISQSYHLEFSDTPLSVARYRRGTLQDAGEAGCLIACLRPLFHSLEQTSRLVLGLCFIHLNQKKICICVLNLRCYKLQTSKRDLWRELWDIGTLIWLAITLRAKV
jgi:hypothetical protein